MRPVGEIRLVLLQAVEALSTPERSPTLIELAMHTRVGFLATRRTVDNMRRAGVLVVPRTRVVDYRNRPVAEYCTPGQLRSMGVETIPLRELFASWRTPIV